MSRSGGHEVVIFTDGSCLNNGRPNARAGFGVYCPDNQKLNYASRLDGAQTSSRAEILGARCGVLRAKQFGYKNILLRLDSEYVIRGATDLLPVWESERPIRSSTNLEDFRLLRDSMRGLQVEFEWIPREENGRADYLAYRGANYNYGEERNIVYEN